jgi:HEAT repeat protein
MDAVETSIKTKDWYQDMVTSRPSTQLANFDYVPFFDRAVETRLVQANPMMRRSVAEALRHLADARSVPLLKKLLDDTNLDVRYHAVTALTRIHKGGPFPSVGLFTTNEAAYVGFWKEKLK